MHPRRSTQGTLVAVAVTLVMVVGACSSSDGGKASGGSTTTAKAPATTTTSTTIPVAKLPEPHPPRKLSPALEQRVRAAIERSVPYLAATMDQARPIPTLRAYSYLGQAYDMPELRDAVKGAKGKRPADAGDRLLWRLVDPSWEASDLPSVEEAATSSDGLMGLALACDQKPPPAGYGTALDRGRRLGDYNASHAALAVGWVTELGCRVAGVPEVHKRLVADLAAAQRRAVPSDLGYEQSAMLGYLGRPDQIGDAWIEQVLAAQRPDGGWAEAEGGASSWHPSLLATWTLAAALAPPAAPMIKGNVDD